MGEFSCDDCIHIFVCMLKNSTSMNNIDLCKFCKHFHERPSPLAINKISDNRTIGSGDDKK